MKIMKKTTLILIVAAVIMLSFFTGCDKYHRDRYTGTWEFTTIITLHKDNNGETTLLQSDTLYYLGSISLGTYENQLLVKYTASNEIMIGLDSDGNIYTPIEVGGGKLPCGKFEKKDKISFTLIRMIINEGIIDGWENCHIKGIKKGRR
jgi:hypothetical protein